MGMQDLVLTGGVQEVCWSSMAAFDALQAFSLRRDDPPRASRPFDAERDGLVPGGGGAMLLLESLDHARERGANIYAEILGYAFSSDGTHLTVPSADGARRCIRSVLTQANLEPGDVDYVNAHATSTRVGDRAEAQALHDVFGEACPPVSSTKSMTGHECWMAGASECIYTIQMMRDGFIAPNINFREQEPDAPRIPIVTETREASIRIALKDSFGFGGTNACLLLGAYDG
jgi:3-oxoacyl-[acyl-carrier-protein] synthase-1